MKATTTCYKVTIEVTRHEKVVLGRTWILNGDPDKPEGTYGYTPNVVEITALDRTLLEMTVNKLDVPALTQAILKHSKPLV